MKKKDIVTLVIALAVIVASVVFMFRILSPAPAQDPAATESNTIPTIPTEIDETTYKDIEGLSDYGQVELDNIGKKDLFAGF